MRPKFILFTLAAALVASDSEAPPKSYTEAQQEATRLAVDAAALGVERFLGAATDDARKASATILGQSAAIADRHFAVSLNSGTPMGFSLPSVSTPTLMDVSGSFQISVPAGATRLDVLLVTTTPGADVDLYVRYGSPPAISGGTVISDYKSESVGGNESISISPVQQGIYYITLGLYSTGVNVSGTVTATVSQPLSPPPPSNGPLALTSGVAAGFSLPSVSAPTLMDISGAFQINVPQNVNRLEIRVITSTAGANVDLYVRRGSLPSLAGGAVVHDYQSATSGGNETVLITNLTSPPLQPGVYYMALTLMTTGTSVAGTITATASTATELTPPPRSVVLTSGVPAGFSLTAVTAPTLMTTSGAFQITVPPLAGSLDIRVATTTPGADVDLYVRHGRAPEIFAGTLLYDFKSEGLTGDEQVTISSTSRPALQAGVYYITLGLYSTGVGAAGTVTATIASGNLVTPTLDAFLNTAGGQRRWISPGSLATVVAPGIATGIAGCSIPNSQFGALPLTLAGASIVFGGVPAPIFSVCNSNGQESMTVQVPVELAPGPVPVTLRSTISGNTTVWPAVPLLPVSPAIYETTMSDGRRRAVILRSDNSFASLENRVFKGETVRAIVTGMGPLHPGVATNRPARGTEAVMNAVVVGVNNAGVDPLYSVALANTVGAVVVAFEIPLNAPSGSDIPLVIASRPGADLVFSNASSIPIL